MKTVWSIDIEAAPERIWEELTATGKVQKFFWNSIFEAELRPGGALRYVTPDRKHTFIEGRVVEVEAPRRFVHTFRFTDLAEPEQTVSFELEPLGTGTRLTVRHEGLDTAPKHARRVTPGWTSMLGDLKLWTESGRISLGSTVRNTVMTAMLPLMPKRDGASR